MIDNFKAIVYGIGMTLVVGLFLPILPFFFFWSYKHEEDVFNEDEYEEYEEWG